MNLYKSIQVPLLYELQETSRPCNDRVLIIGSSFDWQAMGLYIVSSESQNTEALSLLLKFEDGFGSGQLPLWTELFGKCFWKSISYGFLHLDEHLNGEEALDEKAVAESLPLLAVDDRNNVLIDGRNLGYLWDKRHASLWKVAAKKW